MRIRSKSLTESQCRHDDDSWQAADKHQQAAYWPRDGVTGYTTGENLDACQTFFSQMNSAAASNNEATTYIKQQCMQHNTHPYHLLLHWTRRNVASAAVLMILSSNALWRQSKTCSQCKTAQHSEICHTEITRQHTCWSENHIHQARWH